MISPNKRLDLLTRLGMGKRPQNKTIKNENENNEKMKIGKVFYL